MQCMPLGPAHSIQIVFLTEWNQGNSLGNEWFWSEAGMHTMSLENHMHQKFLGLCQKDSEVNLSRLSVATNGTI